MTGRTHRNDILLIAALLLCAGAMGLFLLLTRHAGALVRVTVDGETAMELPLDEDADLVIGAGDRTNRLVIRNGAATVTEASCPDRLCVKQGEIRYAGQSIVCLPHGLVVSVENGPDGGFDAVVH